MNEELIDSIEENVEDIPQEVQDFIFGDELQTIKDELAPHFSDKTQQLQIENNIGLFLLGGMTFEELANSINNLTIAEEKKVIIKTIIQQKIFDELRLLIEVHNELDKGGIEESLDSNVADTSNPEPVNAVSKFDQLKQNLAQPTTFAPTKRVYGSIEKPISTPLRSENSAGQATTPPKIDPYRELPLV